MPRPVGSSTAYLPGLDGLRALSVIVVVGYHLQVPYLDGGLLGVGMFFTLSGYLITSILMKEWRSDGRIDLKNFWIRRARRLVPAVVLLLAVVLAATAIVRPDELNTRVFESVAAMFYVSNWTTIYSGVSYFDRFGGLGPLDHLWSLAIEEQFYVVWPLALLALLKLSRRRTSIVLVAVVALAGVSFWWMWELSSVGFDNTRAYEGTDTRAGGMLIGVVLAILMSSRGRHAARSTRPVTRIAIDLIGAAALGVIGWLVVTTNEFAISLYRGDLLILSVATVAVLTAVVHPGSHVSRALGVQPLRWIGERSYGIYLWHLPLIAFTPAYFLEDAPVLRGTILVAATLAISTLSWSLFEDPIRRHGFVGALQLSRASEGSSMTRFVRRPASAVAWGFMAILGTTVLSAAALIGSEPEERVEALAGPGPAPVANLKPVPIVAPSQASRIGESTTSTTEAPPVKPETSCAAVTHVGDSTSLGLVSEYMLPDPADRIDAQYRLVGVETLDPDILGARSIVEKFKKQPNAQEAVAARIDAGYQGCWVFALGTNEAANIFVGGPYSEGERVDLLMSQIGDSPALWLTVRSLRNRGPYGDAEMAKWNDALREACARYPNMRLYDWAVEVRDEWFDKDEIHFTTLGNQERSRRTAIALATGFPLVADPPDGCEVVTPESAINDPRADVVVFHG